MDTRNGANGGQERQGCGEKTEGPASVVSFFLQGNVGVVRFSQLAQPESHYAANRAHQDEQDRIELKTQQNSKSDERDGPCQHIAQGVLSQLSKTPPTSLFFTVSQLRVRCDCRMRRLALVIFPVRTHRIKHG